MIAGIVCEYNPFHNGHLYHIEKTRQAGAEYIVCVMSGNFVQRGGCAVADKWQRAQAAVSCGADLVIDLPVPWALGSAESFARGSISLLSALGINQLSFGCETEDKELLYLCARATDDSEVVKKLREYMSEGMNYPAALARAVGEKYGQKAREIISSPNSTLAVEYIKAVKKYCDDCDIFPLMRAGTDHDSEETSGEFASASKIRGMLFDEEAEGFMPEKTVSAIKKALADKIAPSELKYAERAILSCLRDMKKEDFALYVTDSGGLSDRLYNSTRTAQSLEEIYEGAKSKNYTLSRVRREVLNLFLRIPKEYGKRTPPYIRVLAASEKGLSLLKKASLPVVTRQSEAVFEDEFAEEIYELQCSSTDKYALMSERVRPTGLEQKNSIIIVR